MNHRTVVSRTRRAGLDRRGALLVYVTVCMVILAGFVSLAIDLGRVRMAHTELKTAADAGVFAGMQYIRTDQDEAKAQALATAEANSVHGAAVDLVAADDVVMGRWRYYSKTFETGGSRINALRVIARRTAARSNAIPLGFAKLIGFNTWDVEAASTAQLTGGRATLGIVGIDSLTMVGTAETDSYNSTEGAYNINTRYENGDIASNGVITLTGTVDVNGSVHTGPEGDMDAGGNTTITGDEFPFPDPLEYPPVDAGPYFSANQNAYITDIAGIPANKQPYKPANHDLLIGANINFHFKGVGESGVDPTLTVVRYHVRNFTAHGTATITVGPNVELYVTGSTVDVAGNVGPSTTSGSPDDFKIFVDGAASIKITGQGNQNNQFQGVLYAPESAITIGGNTDFYGAVIGRTLDIQGTAGIHYDEALGYEQTWPEDVWLVE